MVFYVYLYFNLKNDNKSRLCAASLSSQKVQVLEAAVSQCGR